MRTKNLLFVFFFYAVITPFSLFSQKDNIFCKQITSLNTTLNTNHYNPKTIDDDFSSTVFTLFIDSLDPDKNIFTQSDVDILAKQKNKLDDFINNNDCSFINGYKILLQEKIHTRIQFLSGLKKEKLSYNSKDSIHFIPKKEYSHFNNEITLNKYWNKRVRLNVLHKVYDKDSTLSYLKNHFIPFEKKIKQDVIEKEICLLQEILNQDIDLVIKERFLNSIAQYQDSNSFFFNYSEKESFESSLSNNNLSFGVITNKNKEGNIFINHIRPGSSAFLNQEIEVNDIILSLNSQEETLSTNCVSNENIRKFLNDHDTIVFKIKKENGKILNIKLKKTISKIEENSVRGYLINNNYGYVKIPSFYTNVDSPSKLGLANDLAKEIYKLKKEKITGLILDLRFNGGGSMKEASDLVGMFINRGPVTILKHKTELPYTVKDYNRGSIFTKPIIIIVNSFSASASELFAGAMQDYNRATIIGSQTFGKATSQIILPIHEDEKLGFAKITTDKFYRVSGKSHQTNGIVPDIKLPSFYDNFKIGEKHNKFTLKSDSVNVSLKHQSLELKNKKLIIEKSKDRITTNEGFQLLKKMNFYYLKNHINKTFSYGLNLESIYNYNNKLYNNWATLEDSFKTLENKNKLKVQNSKSTIQILQFNEEDTKNNELLLDNISTDLYIKEASNILSDYINLNKK